MNQTTKLEPLFDMVLIEIVIKESKVILPDSSNPNLSEAHCFVRAVGSETKYLKEGDEVLPIRLDNHMCFDLNNKPHALIREAAIQAKVHKGVEA